MDFDELNKILDIVRAHDLSEFELEREGFKIKIKKGHLQHFSGPGICAPQIGQGPVRDTCTLRPGSRGAAEAPAKSDLAILKSPSSALLPLIRAGAAPFVEVGDVVKKGRSCASSKR
jgi:biotin carboxyl carrier protein